MADSKPAKPGVSRLRKWGGRLALVGLLFVLAVMVWFSGGRKVVGGIVLDWARGRLERQLEESRVQLPEIADYEALLRKEVKGTNGWEHVEAGCKATAEIELRHQSDKEDLFSTTWHGGFANAWDAEQDTKRTGGLGRIRPDRFGFVLAETEVLAEHSKRASACDSLVCVSSHARAATANRSIPAVPTYEFIGALITRVRLLALVNNTERANKELAVLVTLAAKLNARGSKRDANYVLDMRNDVLEFAALPLIRAGQVDAQTRSAIQSVRWRTPGKDPQLWLNNAADAYDMLHYCLTHEFQAMSWMDKDQLFVEAHYVRAYADWMDVVTKNALAARRGELDLRDKDWVKHYNAQFESPFALVNGVVPCGRETMSRLVGEVEREDELWDEIEAMAK